ncbi:MAG: hypothetical protein CMP49_01725 [Flavobacteriales bacterium]|jgi:hypothetical protein|nr:hypothetical protein [Flavobacteriales bacterium]|tara:strand:+ start:194 stop:793 length:600 start_codon:yes stop_codon:yes gene_type:complete
MNKLIILLLITSSISFSQNFNAGVTFGINTSQVSSDNLSGFNKLGIRTGMFIYHNFNSFLVQTELLYINKGSRENIEAGTYSEGYRFHLNYLELPISLKKNIYKNIDCEIGLSISYLLNWTEEYNGYEQDGIDINQMEYSAHIGLGKKILKNLYFTTRLSNSIFPIRSSSSHKISKWYHGQYNTSISFVLCYLLKYSSL